MKKIDLTIFDDEGAQSLVESLGVKTVFDKSTLKTYLMDEHDQKIVCDCCGSEIHINNVGNILKGSKKFYCKNPACFSHYLISKKL